MATIGISRASKLLKVSAMATRAFSLVRPPIPEMTDKEFIADQMKTLFPRNPVNPNLEEKKALSINEEKVSQEVKNLCLDYMQGKINDHKVDPGLSLKGKSGVVRTFTHQRSDGMIVSGANLYIVDRVDGKDKNKLVKTIAFEVDEKGNIIKPIEGLDMVFLDEYDE